mmetsp:Transcript_85911/g.228339  ORF Transcript_85911/g.228339 Transcript_85911/m.228339 type:complete len:254 (+) Transcript_85911:110-871(+)
MGRPSRASLQKSSLRARTLPLPWEQSTLATGSRCCVTRSARSGFSKSKSRPAQPSPLGTWTLRRRATGARVTRNSPPAVGWQPAAKSTPAPKAARRCSRRPARKPSSGSESGRRARAWRKKASRSAPTCTRSTQAPRPSNHRGAAASPTSGKSSALARMVCTCCVGPMEEATTGFCPASKSASPGSAAAAPPSGQSRRASRTTFSTSVTPWFGTLAPSSTQSSVPSSNMRLPGRQAGLSAQPPPPWPRPWASP